MPPPPPPPSAGARSEDTVSTPPEVVAPVEPSAATTTAPTEAVDADVDGAAEDPSPLEAAVLHHDFDERSRGVGDGEDLLAPAPTAVPVPNGHRAVDLLAPPKPAPGEVVPQVPVEMLDRGQPGTGEVGLSLEDARRKGVEVVHGFHIDGCPAPIDHLVLAVNGVWVVDAVDVLTGKLERRDEGDWFTADPRLHIGGVDHTYLVTAVREKVEAVAHLLARTDFTDIPVRGVLCFGTVQPGWVGEPFVLDGVMVTWERRLIEPLLDPILIDQPSRNALLQEFVASQLPWQPVVSAELEAG